MYCALDVGTKKRGLKSWRVENRRRRTISRFLSFSSQNFNSTGLNYHQNFPFRFLRFRLCCLFISSLFLPLSLSPLSNRFATQKLPILPSSSWNQHDESFRNVTKGFFLLLFCFLPFFLYNMIGFICCITVNVPSTETSASKFAYLPIYPPMKERRN